MQSPVTPGTRDSRFTKLRLLNAYAFMLGTTLIEFSLTSWKANQTQLFYLMWGPPVLFLLVGNSTEALIARIGPCSSFGDQAHMLLHRSLRFGVVVGTLVTFIFHYLLR